MVSNFVLISLVFALVFTAACPLCGYLFSRSRVKVYYLGIIVGAGVFFITAMVLERVLNRYVLATNQVSSQFLSEYQIAYVVYSMVVVAGCEEAGRFIAMSLLALKSLGRRLPKLMSWTWAPGDPGAGMSYGLGHGGMEAILLGCYSQAQTFLLAIVLNADQLETVFGEKMPIYTMAQLRVSLENITATSVLLGGVERFGAFMLQIALSLIMWRAVDKRRWRLVALAFGLHALAYAPAALYQVNLLPFILTECIYGVAGVAILAALVTMLPRRRREPVDRPLTSPPGIEPAPRSPPLYTS